RPPRPPEDPPPPAAGHARRSSGPRPSTPASPRKKQSIAPWSWPPSFQLRQRVDALRDVALGRQFLVTLAVVVPGTIRVEPRRSRQVVRIAVLVHPQARIRHDVAAVARDDVMVTELAVPVAPQIDRVARRANAPDRTQVHVAQTQHVLVLNA